MFSKKNQNTSAGYGDETHTSTGYDNPTFPTHGTPTSNPEGGRAPHKSSLLNKLDPRVDSTAGQRTDQYPSGNTHHDGGAFGADSRHDAAAHGTSNTGHGTGTAGHHGDAGYGNTGLAGQVRMVPKRSPTITRTSPTKYASSSHNVSCLLRTDWCLDGSANGAGHESQ